MARREDLVVTFNGQQLALIDQFVVNRGLAASYEAAVQRALDEAPDVDTGGPTRSCSPQTPVDRQVLEQHTLQPGTGKCVVVPKGKILRVQQIEGGQCVDFNCYNLANRNEVHQVGRTRSIHGLSPMAGDMLWSKTPWERPLMFILASNAVTDTLYPPCSALLYNLFYQSNRHTNCQQIQAEAQREYGLAAHRVHESLNLFMHVVVHEGGLSEIVRNGSRAGDFIDLYALVHILAIPNVCGDDYGKTNNFRLKPVRVQVMEALAADHAAASSAVGEFEGIRPFVEPRDPDASPLTRDPSYRAAFPFVPLEMREVTVALTPGRFDRLQAIRDRDLYGDDLGAALRDVMMAWIDRNIRVYCALGGGRSPSQPASQAT